MVEGKRQKQVASVISEAMNDIFRHLSLNIIDGGMVSISSVKLTPDLLEARVYISFLNVADPKETIKKIENKQWEIKKALSSSIKQQLRRVPELKFFLDDTLEYVFKMEELLNKIKEESNPPKED
jgi:ribosome-binding factor A